METPNGMACAGGMTTTDPLCTEQFNTSNITALKVVTDPGYAFTDWIVNGVQAKTADESLILTMGTGLAGKSGVLPGSTAVCQANCERQTVYLTFDDGPLGGTDDVLRILGEEGAVGTFLMVGVHIVSAQREEWVREAASSFEIGNHSYSHPWQTEDVTAYYTGAPEVVLNDFQNNDLKLSSTLNLSPAQQFVQARLPTKNTWRVDGIPPITDGTGGAAADLLQSNGYEIYGWDVLWDRTGVHPKETPEEIAEMVENAPANQSTKKNNKVIVLMHDDMFKQSVGDDIKLRQFIQILDSCVLNNDA